MRVKLPIQTELIDISVKPHYRLLRPALQHNDELLTKVVAHYLKKYFFKTDLCLRHHYIISVMFETMGISLVKLLKKLRTNGKDYSKNGTRIIALVL